MKTLKTTTACLFLFSLTMAYYMYKFGYGVNDGFWRTAMIPFEGTVWSEGFSEVGFNKVNLGMSSRKVLELLGEPLQKNCDKNDCFWIYTWQDTGTADFDQRWIIFNLDDRVIEIRKSFYID